MSKATNHPPQDKLALYDQLVATHPEIERKGKTMPYTSVNGHMFTILDKSGSLGIRLSKADREAFVAKYASPPFVSYGAVMKEYVAVPDDLLQKTAELSPYLAQSYDYVRSLKPKPTKKKQA
jgi:TfoX/Sxy family transcriptional regulator of competence genes